MMIGNIWVLESMIPDLCRGLGVRRTTVTNWMERRKLPRAIETLLDLTHNGNLARIHDDWDGWAIDPEGGELLSPCKSYGRRLGVNQGAIMSIELRHQQIAALRRDNDQLKAQHENQLHQITELEARVAELEAFLKKSSDRNVIEWRKRHPG